MENQTVEMLVTDVAVLNAAASLFGIQNDGNTEAQGFVDLLAEVVDRTNEALAPFVEEALALEG